MTDVSHRALSPLSFLDRSADVWAERIAVSDGERSWSYAELRARVGRLGGLLRDEYRIGQGDRVAALLPNTASMLELHYAVPGIGAVLVPMNTRLSAPEYAYVLDHSGAGVLVVDAELEPVAREALALIERPLALLSLGRDEAGRQEYERLLAASREAEPRPPREETDLLSINYTSGTTGRPKGVMTSHRGAYLHSLGVMVESGMGVESAYLWTLPMFHCNGWAYTWAVTGAGARHVCQAEIVPAALWAAIEREAITHMCAAPTVVTMMFSAPEAAPAARPVQLFVGGAPPAPRLLQRVEELNFQITHLYGLTETYGPIGICAWNPDWDRLDAAEQARLRARQGVSTVVSERLRVVDEEMRDVPRDGSTLGEVVARGNNVMVGYYRDPPATAEAFRGGWFHTGDLAVMHPDGYLELYDRLKDIVISGGENIATIEVEQAMAAHGSVAEVAVIGVPDEHWGEVPVAFVILAPGAELDAEEMREFLRARLARFKVPKRIEVVGELPKTATGKIQKHVLRQGARPSSPHSTK